MSMDIDQAADGHQQLKLGPVERWIVTAAAALLICVLGYLTTSFATRLEDLGAKLGEISTQQAVTNAQISTLSAQLADVPGLTQKIAELRVQTDRNAEDIKELRATKGLR